MGVIFPDPKRLTTYLEQEEMPRRLTLEPSLPVADLFRYGGMVGSHIHAYSSLPRCMDQARELIKQQSLLHQSLPSGTTVFAESLHASKGRFRRVWHAPEGGLWCVLAVFNQWSPRVVPLLPLVTGVAVCETVRQYGLAAQIKWVNDVRCNGRKLAGLLAETHVCPISGEEYILLGVGLNVNNSSFPPELSPFAISMSQVAEYEFDIGLLALDLLAKLQWNIGLLCFIDEEDQSRGLFMDRYRALCDSVGRHVRFGFDVQQSPQYEARITGIRNDGGLMLHHLRDDVELVEHGGEVEYLD